jgi:membrane associated rhomboid family serine protease
MGIYDRDYYRREGPSFLGALGRTGQVCKWLLFINGGIFLLQLLTMHRGAQGGPVTDWLILDTNKVFGGQFWRLLTYAFLHDPGNILHVVFNMLFLWWMGSEVEGIYGQKEFASFYVVAALLGGIAFQAYFGVAIYRATGSLLSPIAIECLGASGAVTAVMVLYACHFPTRTILLFFVIPVPMWAFVGFLVLGDALYFMNGSPTTTAVVVHLAGAGFGFAYYKLQWRLSPAWTWLLAERERRSRPRLRVYKGSEEQASEPVPVAAPSGDSVDEQLEAKLDAVLEKVARSGQASLSESEREILFRASEIYKKRRT